MSERKHNYASLMVRSLEDFNAIEVSFDSNWFFRGQRCSHWDLETSLERKDSALKRSEYAEFERNSLVEARRLLEWGDDSGDAFSRLAFLQHHGCRTRLLDFTRCLKVALYFAAQPGACEKDGNPTRDGAIWAISRSALDKKICGLMGDPSADSDAASQRLIQQSLSVGAKANTPAELAVVFCQPALPNPRIVAQKGLFLAPLNLQNDFKANLTIGLNLTGAKEPVRRLNSIEDLPSALNGEDVIKLIILEEARAEMLKYLADQGINEESLYPKVDEFVKRLNEWRPMKEVAQ